MKSWTRGIATSGERKVLGLLLSTGPSLAFFAFLAILMGLISLIFTWSSAFVSLIADMGDFVLERRLN
jgi:hypothetical protein